jgi:hypothetical protein
MAFSLEELEQQLRSTHGHARIEAFLWGLLPDNDRVLQNWGRRFQVSPKNVFRLISHVGEDCAGAIQFVSPERLETLIAEPAAREIQWLTEEDVAERLRTLRADHSAWRAAGVTQGNSALPVHSRRRHFYLSASGGECRRAVSPPLTFWNPQRGNGTAMQRMSISPCNWRARSDSLFPTPASCAFRMRSLSL